MLEPSPPKTILPMAMANALPSTAAHTGRAGGNDSARISPVNIALPSCRLSGRRRIRLHNHSVAAHASTHTVISTAARTRKYTTLMAMAGTSASITSSMIRRVEYAALMCGAGPTLILLNIVAFTCSVALLLARS